MPDGGQLLEPRRGHGAAVEVRVPVVRLAHFPADWELPAYQTPGAAAVDLRNAGPDVTLASLERTRVPTGLSVAIPAGYEGQVRPRSGLASKRGLTLPNTPGTIDSDYRGEILVPMVNLDAAPQTIAHGERIAQMLVSPVARLAWEEAPELPPTRRGEGGFGSTGS